MPATKLVSTKSALRVQPSWGRLWFRVLLFASIARAGISEATSTNQSTWTILSGSAYCEVSADGLCITDGPGNYGNDERCEVRAEGAMFLNVAAFNTESNFDYITIGTDRYSGTVGPVGIQLGSGDTVSW